MSSAKEIRDKIKSVSSTQKITKAMQMVAASKMRKAKKRMCASRPYSEKIREVIAHLKKGRLEFEHPYLVERPEKRVGIIVVSSDRGLCGGLNVLLFKKVMQKIHKCSKENVGIDLAVIGRKASEFFLSYDHASILAKISCLGDSPNTSDLIGVVTVMLKEYREQKIDKVFLAYNKFINTMTQEPEVECLVPLVAEETTSRTHWDYIYEPSPSFLLNNLLTRYVESLVYQGVVDNLACEQAARMVAMKSATDNAGELIREFKISYNKARQASITQELSEIVSGAAAV